MEATRKHDVVQESNKLENHGVRFAPAVANVSGTAEAKAEGVLGGKPVASVRHSLASRRVSPTSSQPAAVFEPLLDLHEASAILGMHWKTLEAKARGRAVPAFKVGKRWRFRLSALNSWLEHGINSNTTDHAAVTRPERCS